MGQFDPPTSIVTPVLIYFPTTYGRAFGMLPALIPIAGGGKKRNDAEVYSAHCRFDGQHDVGQREKLENSGRRAVP